MFEVKIDMRGMNDMLDRIGKKTLRQATVRAMNSTMTTLRTHAQREATKELGLKRKDVIKRFFVDKAKGQKTQARLRIYTRGIALAAFAPKKVKVMTERGRRIGATVAVGAARKLVPGGFLVELKSGKVGVFARKGEQRLPIRQLFSSAFGDLFQPGGSLMRSLRGIASETFEKNFARDFAFFESRNRK